VKERLNLALAALVVVSALALWGLIPASAGKRLPVGDGTRPTGAARSPVSLRPPAGYRLTFDASFSGSALNTSVWDTCYWWMDVSTGCNNFGNREHQWFLPTQDQVYGGALHLVAAPIPTQGLNRAGAPKHYSCRSGMVTTYHSYSFEYGYVQIVARVPSGAGLWSALWLAAANRKWPPEIDIVEHWAAARTGVYFHPVGLTHVGARPDPPGLFRGWHTYTLQWTRSKIIWYIDGQEVMYVTRHVPHQLMYFIADLADSWRPGGCSGTMLIRSVKIWQGQA
jgi:beta-glucanase (GH16 family)